MWHKIYFEEGKLVPFFSPPCSPQRPYFIFQSLCSCCNCETNVFSIDFFFFPFHSQRKEIGRSAGVHGGCDLAKTFNCILHQQLRKTPAHGYQHVRSPPNICSLVRLRWFHKRGSAFHGKKGKFFTFVPPFFSQHASRRLGHTRKFYCLTSVRTAGISSIVKVLVFFACFLPHLILSSTSILLRRQFRVNTEPLKHISDLYHICLD